MLLTITTAAHYAAQLLFQSAGLQIDRLLFAFQGLQLTFNVGQLLQLNQKQQIKNKFTLTQKSNRPITFFSRCGDTLSITASKLCSGELRSFAGLVRDAPFVGATPS